MPALNIAVVSDVICPWCYLGKRRLERALDELGLRAGTSIGWLPFELNPDMPEDGMERSAYRAAKFGAARGAALDEQMTARGVEDGVAFAFAHQPRTPNTRKAHMLIAHASEAGRGDAVVEALFHAYFEEGRDVGSEAVLIDIAASAGLDRAAASSALADEGLRAGVERFEAQAGQLGIAGVPFFIINETYAVSGAQPADQWVETLRDIMSRPAPEAGRPVATP